MTTYRLAIEGMTCTHCEQTVEEALARAGVTGVSADWRRGEATFDFEGALEIVRTAVEEGGYRPGELTPVAVAAPVPRLSSTADFDLLVIGSGSAAFAAAIRATSLGGRVALVERDTIGGTCVNTGCVPSKRLLVAADTYYRAGHHAFAGVATSQGPLDVAAVITHKAALVDALRAMKYEDLAKEYGFEIISGDARFASPDAVAVGARTLRAGHFLIATGARAWAPPIAGLEEAGYLTSTEALGVKELPGSLAVIGGNYIGLEMGQVFAHLGSRVTLLEVLDRVAPLEEPEISAWMTRVLSDDGIDVVTSAQISSVERSEHGRVARYSVDGEERTLVVDEVLVATGRRPALDDLGLEQAGIERDARGALVLDDQLRTTNPRVFAAGDVTGAPQFVYVAAAQGTLVADNALSGAGRSMDYRALPRVTFTTPQIAAVGLTEAEAQKAGHDVEGRVLDLEHIPRPLVNADTRGAFKLVADAATGKVLGVHVIAEGAGDLILAGVYAVKFGLTIEDLATTWSPYLTMAEGIKLAAQTFSADVDKLSCCAA